MASEFPWLAQNWFQLLEAIGITSGLFFTGITIRQQTKARKISDMLLLTQQHRELWSELHRRPALARVLEPEVDVSIAPMTREEEEFLNLVIVHFTTGWHLTRKGALLTMDVLEADARDFFQRPLPNIAWERSKRFRDPAFIRFIERCLREPE